jgi:hypothetical protein
VVFVLYRTVNENIKLFTDFDFTGLKWDFPTNLGKLPTKPPVNKLTVMKSKTPLLLA